MFKIKMNFYLIADFFPFFIDLIYLIPLNSLIDNSEKSQAKKINFYKNITDTNIKNHCLLLLSLLYR